MKPNRIFNLSASVIVIEAVAFAVIALMVWIDELIDIPHLFLGARATPVNWQESIFESASILLVAAVVFTVTGQLFARIKRMERCLPICSSCKRIRDPEDSWHQIESYLKENPSSSSPIPSAPIA